MSTGKPWGVAECCRACVAGDPLPIRTELARKLLQEQGLMTKEVAARTGYRNADALQAVEGVTVTHSLNSPTFPAQA